MNGVLREILETRKVTRPDSRMIPISSGVSREKGELLQDLVRKIDPLVTLEVGLAYGISALCICDSLRIREGTRHIAIDPNQHGGPWGESWDGIGIANLEQAGFGGIFELIEKPSFRALPELEAAGLRIDFAFVDGWHTFDFTLVDFFYIDRMLRIGGIVALDDANWSSVGKFCRFATTNLAYSVAGVAGPIPQKSWKRRLAERLLPRTPLRKCLTPELRATAAQLGIEGQCVALRKERDDNRRWDHFVPF